jgi:heme/copper-type cytochrome/quinol oxidase subunit 1
VCVELLIVYTLCGMPLFGDVGAIYVVYVYTVGGGVVRIHHISLADGFLLICVWRFVCLLPDDCFLVLC